MDVKTTKKSKRFHPLNQYPLIPNPSIFKEASVINTPVKTRSISLLYRPDISSKKAAVVNPMILLLFTGMALKAWNNYTRKFLE